MKIRNKKVLKRVLEVSLITGLTLSTMTGCSTPLQQAMVEESKNEEDTFVTKEDIIKYKWYIICIENSPKYEENVYLTKLNTYADITSLDVDRKEYYYHEIFSKEVMGTVYYDKTEDKVVSRMGPQIEYAISLEDYLKEMRVEKESYTKLEIMAIYSQVRQDYSENDLKKVKSEKVYVK